jgi:muramoyltetrapeptide carboxypeptidase
MPAARFWSPLKKGDIVDVVAPASSCLDHELEDAVDYVKNLGLVPHIPKDLFKRRFVFSNSDEYRLTHLAYALTNKESKAVWCVRGGYGSMRLLPALQKVRRPLNPKLFIGLSDITSLHAFLNQKWNWPTIHGPILARLGSDAPSNSERREVANLIFGKFDQIEFKLKPLNAKARGAKINSSVVGGNLEVIGAGLATPWQLDTREKILFLEEINERGYRVDRRFQNFWQAGLFEKAKAIVFGDFIGGEEPGSQKQMWRYAINELAESVKIPVYSGLKSGHGKLQRPLPFNTHATISKSLLHCTVGTK